MVRFRLFFSIWIIVFIALYCILYCNVLYCRFSFDWFDLVLDWIVLFGSVYWFHSVVLFVLYLDYSVSSFWIILYCII